LLLRWWLRRVLRPWVLLLLLLLLLLLRVLQLLLLLLLLEHRRRVSALQQIGHGQVVLLLLRLLWTSLLQLPRNCDKVLWGGVLALGCLCVPIRASYGGAHRCTRHGMRLAILLLLRLLLLLSLCHLRVCRLRGVANLNLTLNGSATLGLS